VNRLGGNKQAQEERCAPVLATFDCQTAGEPCNMLRYRTSIRSSGEYIIRESAKPEIRDSDMPRRGSCMTNRQAMLRSL
jgi:hypothetical protein